MTIAIEQASGLPSPADLPQADVVVYDGHCRFCLANVRLLCRLDGRGRLSFLSLHDEEAGRRYPDLSHEELMRQMYLIDTRGNRYAGAAAFRYLTRRLPCLWPLMPLMHIPLSLPLWQAIYRFIARQRYRFGRTEACDSDSCRIHLR